MKDRVGEYRRRMRERGLRPLQVWVPDVRTPEFAAQAHMQSVRVAEADKNGNEQDFVEAVAAPWDDEA